MLRAWLAASFVAVGVVAVDQAVKTWAVNALANRAIELPGSAMLRLVYNRGVAFGLGEGVATFLVPVALVVFVAILVRSRMVMSRPAMTAVGMVLGGAAGNLADRLWRAPGGAVIDYVDLRVWPVFNVADACIVVGAVILVLSAGRRPAPSNDNET